MAAADRPSDVSEVGTGRGPPSESARLLGVDAARGVALLGMMAIHVLPGVDADGSPSAPPGGGWSLRSALRGARGCGLALANGGVHPPRGRAWAAAGFGTLVRAALIAAIGLVVGMAGSGVAVILVYYALLFVLAIPLLPLGPRILGPLAAVVAIVVPVLSHLLRPGLDRPDRGNPVLTTLLGDPVGTLQTLAITGYYPVLAWMTYLCAGLAVGRLQLRSKAVAWWLVGGGLALAVGSSVGSAALLGPFGGADRLRDTLQPGIDLGQTRRQPVREHADNVVVVAGSGLAALEYTHRPAAHDRHVTRGAGGDAAACTRGDPGAAAAGSRGQHDAHPLQRPRAASLDAVPSAESAAIVHAAGDRRPCDLDDVAIEWAAWSARSPGREPGRPCSPRDQAPIDRPTRNDDGESAGQGDDTSTTRRTTP